MENRAFRKFEWSVWKLLDCRLLHQIPKGFWEPWAAPKTPAVSNEPPSENFCLRACIQIMKLVTLCNFPKETSLSGSGLEQILRGALCLSYEGTYRGCSSEEPPNRGGPVLQQMWHDAYIVLDLLTGFEEIKRLSCLRVEQIWFYSCGQTDVNIIKLYDLQKKKNDAMSAKHVPVLLHHIRINSIISSILLSSFSLSGRI